MKYFCDNPECPNHVKVSDEIHGSSFAVNVHGQRMEVRNHQYVYSPIGVRFFCDWCSNAIQFHASNKRYWRERDD